MSVRLYLIRHGQSEVNATQNIVCGQSISSTLSPLGNEEAKLLGKRLKYENVKFDHILCSTAVRAIQTANIALKIMNLDASKLVISSALLEQSQGNWEGMERTLFQTVEIRQQKHNLHVEFCPPQGESLRMVEKRAIAYLEPYIEQAKQQSMIETRQISMGIFTHAGLVRAVLQYYLQSNPRYSGRIRQNNTAITEILLDKQGFSLVKLNDYGHLMFFIPEMETDSLQNHHNGQNNECLEN